MQRIDHPAAAHLVVQLFAHLGMTTVSARGLWMALAEREGLLRQPDPVVRRREAVLRAGKRLGLRRGWFTFDRRTKRYTLTDKAPKPATPSPPKGDPVTNTQLLETPEHHLRGLDRQRLFLLRMESVRVPCPACETPLNLFEAAGIGVDDYDFGATPYPCRCGACGAELEQVVPAMTFGPCPWHWQLRHSWLQERLQKARAFDEQQARNSAGSPPS